MAFATPSEPGLLAEEAMIGSPGCTTFFCAWAKGEIATINARTASLIIKDEGLVCIHFYFLLLLLLNGFFGNCVLLSPNSMLKSSAMDAGVCDKKVTEKRRALPGALFLSCYIVS